MGVDIILGLQWGDEGKGKIVDVFAPDYDLVARFQGGPNAGHTVEFDQKKYILHTIPSGIFHPGIMNIIGNGVIIDPFILFIEIESLREAGLQPDEYLFISRRAHLILPSHRLLDAAHEWSMGQSKIGSTLKGIGPTYTDKHGRTGIRVGQIFDHDFNSYYQNLKAQHLTLIRNLGFEFSDYKLDGLTFDIYEEQWFDGIRRMKHLKIADTEVMINRLLDEGKSAIAEGAQGSMLDVDFGSYPYVTSSCTISAGACSGLGISPKRIRTIYGVFKAYCTRVGGGPFPTELKDETGETIRRKGHEYGATTNRPRRCGWLDVPALNYAIMLNGVSRLIMMKADVLSGLESIQLCTGYSYEGQKLEVIPFDISDTKLTPIYQEFPGWKTGLESVDGWNKIPPPLMDYIHFIEKTTKVPIEIVSIGPDRLQTLKK
jgi:adenylosuccinate synthase